MPEPEPMNGDELRAICERFQWSLMAIERLLDVSHTTVSRWSQDKTRIPDAIAAWLRCAERWIDTHPPPMPPNRQA